MIKKRSGLIIEYANEERKYVKSTERKKEIMFPKKNHPNQPTTPIPTRRSIRKYKPNPVPKHIIDRIIEAAGRHCRQRTASRGSIVYTPAMQKESA